MRIEQNQFVIQDRSQVSGGNTKPEAQSQATSAPPSNAQTFAGKQNQSLNQAESNQGGGNKATSLLSRLASLTGVNPIPVLPIKETEFFINPNTNDSNNHHDRFVHIKGDAIDSDAERDDLQNALKQAEKEGNSVIFVQGDEDHPQYFEATSRGLDGQAPGYISNVQSLAKGSTETFSLDNLEAQVTPLERLKPSVLTTLKSLDSRAHAQLDALGDQGAAFLKVAKNNELLNIAKNLNPQQIQILASLNEAQLEAFRQIPATSRALIDLPPNGDGSSAISSEDFDKMNRIPHQTFDAMRNLSVKELVALQDLKGIPQQALAILDWEKPQLNAIQNLNPDQLNQLQDIMPEELIGMKTLRAQLLAFGR